MSKSDFLKGLRSTKAKEIPGFPGYFATKQGDVFSSIKKMGRRKGIVYMGWRKMTPSMMKGYCAITVKSSNGQVSVKIHTLVALTFVGPKPSDDHEVAHEDGNRLNNHYKNLSWKTRLGNSQDRDRHGTTPKGERHYASRITEDAVKKIFDLRKSGLLQREISKLVGISRPSVANILLGRQWYHLHKSPKRRVVSN